MKLSQILKVLLIPLIASSALTVLTPPSGTSHSELTSKPSMATVDLNSNVFHFTDSAADTQVHANQVWAAGYTGGGIRLAILDSGINQANQEFAGRILAGLCHTEIVGTTCEDDNGHGTHVAGIAAAQGVNAAAEGVAPAVQLMIDKV